MQSFDVLDVAVVPTTSEVVTTNPTTAEVKPTKTIDVMKPTVSQFALKPEK